MEWRFSPDGTLLPRRHGRYVRLRDLATRQAVGAPLRLTLGAA